MLRKVVFRVWSSQWSKAAGLRCLATEGLEQDEHRKKLVNKLLYRSKQRGFLELDLLVGLWAEEQIPKMGTHMLKQFAQVLDQENPDLFKWLTGQQQAPQDMQQNQAYQALSQHVSQQLDEFRPAAAKTAEGKEWIRGWDDASRNKAEAR
eukprot:GHRR01003760.1.p1 GENE.GHRR01003760.1~~GHRR01003760.1.p1  ORF type:complete len:150 (+),score=32.82 GHRR01003760.1:222-671(+)